MVKAAVQTKDEVEATKSLVVPRQNPTLRQQATDILRQAIIDQRFPPGKHLIERELCELLGVSRTSVREALRHLESEDLIEMVPHKGPVVKRLTYDEAYDIYEVRGALEGLAGELFAKNASQAMIDRLIASVDSMIAASYNPDPDVVLLIRSEFYEILFEGAKNAVCRRMTQLLNARVCILGRMALMPAWQNTTMVEEVQRIAEAAKARDVEGMRAACSNHVESASKVVLPQLKQAENEAAQ